MICLTIIKITMSFVLVYILKIQLWDTNNYFHRHQIADALDKFIEQKLKAAGHGLKENSIDVMINPDNDFKIKEGQGAILIV